MAETLLLCAPLAPLCCTGLWLGGARLRTWGRALAPAVALPALALSLWPTAPPAVQVPWLLLGSTVAVDAAGRVMLGFSALLWAVALWYARAYGREDPRRDRFTVLFLATMAGNVGAILAQDAPSFLLAFGLMTFAGYGLVVHDGSAAARRAGRVYLGLAIAGEAMVLVAVLLAAGAAGGSGIGALAAAAAAPDAGLIRLLLVAGFGVKAALLPLHVWLPLAHPIAPTPASAVLSGALIKVGVLGWMRFLPLGGLAAVELGGLLVGAGVLAILFGVACGLAQREVKTLLAYSSVSQMGFLTVGIGIGLADPDAWPAAAAAVLLYAAHHGLTKGALFLVAGTAAAGGSRRVVMAAAAVLALALAGAPLTGGALAKLALKQAAEAAAFTAGWLAPMLAVGAVGTTLVMLRCLRLLSAGATERNPSTGRASALLAPLSAALSAAVLGPWLVAAALDAPLAGAACAPAGLVAAAWPLVAGGLLIAPAVLRRHILGDAMPVVPAGDLLWAVTAALACTRAALAPLRRVAAPTWSLHRCRRDAPAWPEVAERALRSPFWCGVTALALLAALLASAR